MIVIPPVKSKYNDGIPIKLKKTFKSSWQFNDDNKIF